MSPSNIPIFVTAITMVPSVTLSTAAVRVVYAACDGWCAPTILSTNKIPQLAKKRTLKHKDNFY